MRSSTLSKALGILVAAIAIGALIGWWASRNSSHPLPPVVEASAEPEIAPRKNEPAPPAPFINPPVAVAPVQAEVVSPTDLDDPALWEEKLDEILGSDMPEDKMGEELLAMMDKVGTEAQVELAGHVVNLVDDAQFYKTAKYLTNAAVSEEVSSIFMNDLYNRDESVKLPLLLEVARNEKHALRDEARDLLELYVEEDYGTNWVQWEDATKKYLKEHAAETEDSDATGAN